MSSEFVDNPEMSDTTPRDDYTVWSPVLFEYRRSILNKKRKKRGETLKKKKGFLGWFRRSLKGWGSELVEFIYLCAELILSLMKGEMYDIDKLAEFIADEWIKYCDISWFWNKTEHTLVKTLAKALIKALIWLFKSKMLAFGARVKPGRFVC